MTPYALPPPIVTIVHGFTPEQMQQAFKDGAASRDGEVEALRADAARYRWLTEDHPKRETREAVIRIGGSLWCRSKGSSDAMIDLEASDAETKT